MYLLTYEQWPLTDAQTTWRPVFISCSNDVHALSEMDHFESIAREFPTQLRNVELFERRGNDWMRIRPEEDANA